MEAHKMTVPRTAYFHSIGTPGKHVRYFWIACHGYGQLAKNFIRRLDVLSAEDTLVIAPEGLSRFYWQGFGGDVGASWMTRENRLDEIADYTSFLKTLYQTFVPQCADEVRIILMGFSQGCATQIRWIMNELPHFHELLLWAGTLPEDLDYSPHLDYWAGKNLHFVYGTKDPFLTPERLAQHEQLILEKQLAFHTHTFEGEHVVDREMLRRWAVGLRQRAKSH